MADTLTADEIQEFNLYLHNCTDAQVLAVLDKERRALRKAYEVLAWNEARKRGLL